MQIHILDISGGGEGVKMRGGAPSLSLSNLAFSAGFRLTNALRDSHTLNTPELIERSANRLLKDAGSDRQVGRNGIPSYGQPADRNQHLLEACLQSAQ
jgi:hypothetical protein